MTIIVKWWWTVLIGAAIGVGILSYQDDINAKKLINPLGVYTEREDKKTNKSDFVTIGFLPSWMVGKTKTYSKEIDELIFLGVEADQEGNLVWDGQSKKINSEDYISMKNQVRRQGGKNIIGIKLFEDEKLESLLANESARKNLIEQIKEQIVKGNFDGVNVDFEFMNDPTAVLDKSNVNFLKELKQSGIKNISLDVFANTVIKGDETELKEVLDVVDRLIVMAYDFHRPGSDTVGPVAPLQSPVGERNIMEVSTRVIDEGLDKKKIVLAYPLYGYEWKTETTDFEAKAKKGYSAMASYKRVKELLASYEKKINTEVENLEKHYDEVSMTPWISFKEDGAVKQIYYEDLESLSKKFQLVKSSQLGGVGFWALGYEGEGDEVWREVEKILGN